MGGSIDDIEMGMTCYYYKLIVHLLSSNNTGCLYWLTASIAAYFITVDKTVLESARRNSRAQFDKSV